MDAVVVPPGSKSITNRALLVAALADGTSRLEGALVADDTQAMIDCVRGLGAEVEISSDGTTLTVTGFAGVPQPKTSLDARQSGTTARFIAGVLALATEPVLLDADEAMRNRPMGQMFDALRALGVTISAADQSDRLPAHICGPIRSTGSMPTVTIPGEVSSQFISGILLAAPCMPDGLRVCISGDVVSRPYLSMTVEVMRSFGASVDMPDQDTFVVHRGAYMAGTYEIEPDATAASYFFAAAAICGGSVCVRGLGSSSMQGDLGFVEVLRSMGAEVSVEVDRTTVRAAPLHGVTADLSQISDTAQTIAAVAVFADGPTTVTGIGFIRKKETDRIAAIVTELQRIGIDATEQVDGFTVTPGPTVGARIETYDDHRMAMSMALIGLSRPGIVIADPSCVAKTFPTYFEAMEQLRPGGSR